MADNILRIGAEFDVGPIISGAQSAVDSFDKIEAHVQAANSGLRATGSVAQNSASQYEPLLANVARLTQEIQYTRPAIADEAAESEKLLGTISSLSRQVSTETESENINEEAHDKNSEAVSREAIQTRLATDVMTGQFARSEQALVRFASHIPAIGALMEVAFPVFAAAVFVDLLTNMAEKVYHVYQNVVLLKDAINALDKANEEAAKHAAELNFSYEESVARRLAAEGKVREAAEQTAKAQSDKPLEIPQIDDKNFKQFNAEFVTFLQAVHTTADSKSVISRIGEESAATVTQLEQAKEKLAELTRQQEASEATALSAHPIAGPGIMLERQSKLVEDLTKKYEYLQSAKNRVESQTGISENTAAIKVAEDTKRATQEQLHYESEILNVREAAEKSAFSGQRDERVESLRVELSLLDEKKRIEQETISQQVKTAGGGDAEQAAASAFITQKYQQERLTLTRELTAAEETYKQSLILENESAAAAFAENNERLSRAKEALTEIAAKESEMFAQSAERDTVIALRQAEVQATARTHYTETVTKLAEESSLRSIGFEENAAVASVQLEERKRLAFETSSVGRARIEQQYSDEEVEIRKRAEEQKLQTQLQALEAQKAAQFSIHSKQDETSFVVNADPEQLAKLAQVNAQIEAAQAAHTAKMESLNERLKENSEVAAEQIASAYMRAFEPLNSTFTSSLNRVMEGTLRISEAFRRMGVEIVQSTIDSLAQSLLKHVEYSIIVNVLEKNSMIQRIASWLSLESTKKAAQAAANTTEIATVTATEAGKTAAITTAAAARLAVISAGEATARGVEDAAAAAEASTLAGTGAAAAFASVLIALPFPANVAAAPGIAASQFSEIIALGLPKAEMGALVPQDMPISAHEGEMILPKPISSGIQALIPAMHKFGEMMNGESLSRGTPAAAAAAGPTATPDLHMHWNAMDSKSIADFLHQPGVAAQFTKMLHRTVRNGMRLR